MPNLIKNDFWQSITPASRIGKQRGYIEIPAFDVSFDWDGINKIVAVFNYEGTKNFTILTLPTEPDEADKTYIPCIKYRDDEGNVFRYKLWDSESNNIYAPVYSGQKIRHNFQIEIWAIAEDVDAVNEEVIQVFISALQNRSLVDDASTFKFVEESDIVTNLDNQQQEEFASHSQTFAPEIGNLQYFNDDGDILFQPGNYCVRYSTGAYEHVIGSGNWRVGEWDILNTGGALTIDTIGTADNFASQAAVQAAYPKSYSLIKTFGIGAATNIGLRIFNGPASSTLGTPPPTFIIESAIDLSLIYTAQQHGTVND